MDLTSPGPPSPHGAARKKRTRTSQVKKERYDFRLHYRWSQLEADCSGGNTGSPCKPRSKVSRTLCLRCSPAGPERRELLASLKRQARFSLCASTYETIDYNTFAKNGVLKLSEVELYFLSLSMTKDTSSEWSVVYLGVGNGERFKYLRDEFFPELTVIAFDPLDDFFEGKREDIEKNAKIWNEDGSNFTFIIRCFDEEKDIEWIKKQLLGKKLLLISDIRGANFLDDGSFDKERDQDVQLKAIQRLCPKQSLLKFTVPDTASDTYTYVPGVLLKQTFCYYGTVELRLLVDGVPEDFVEYDVWELSDKLRLHHEQLRGQVYKSTRRSDRGVGACLDYCFDCSVLWSTVANYAAQNAMDPYKVLDNILKNHVYFDISTDSFADKCWSDAGFYLKQGRLMEAVAALEASVNSGKNVTEISREDWMTLLDTLSTQQPHLAHRLRSVLPQPESHAELIGLLGSLSKPFTLVRTELNGLLEYPAWSWNKNRLRNLPAEDDKKAEGAVDMSWYKTKPCWYYSRGFCGKGESCLFKHGDDDVGTLVCPQAQDC